MTTIVASFGRADQAYTNNGIIGATLYAQAQVASAQNYVLRLVELSESLTPPVITPEFPTGGSAPALAIPTAPELQEAAWVAPSLPTAFSGTLDLDAYEIEPFDEDPPTIVYGTAPADFSATLPDAPGVSLVFDDPTLSVSLPAVPNLLSLSVTPFDGLNLPTFDADEPTLTVVAPSIREYIPGSGYSSSLLTELQASLLDRIQNGGTGLDAATENAIWERGREREARSYADAVLDLDRMERLGMQLPPGIYLDARLKLIRERDAQDRGHSREVMIKSAELELENVKHALTTAVSLESQLVEYANQVEQRLFESTKYATEAGIAIYNAQVQAFAAMVDVYRAKVQVYEAQIRAEMSRVEAYRTEIAAEEAKAQINAALVQQYKVQVDAALSNIEIYKAEIEGIRTKAEIEKTKVAVFGEQVKAYTAQVNAYTAGIEGFRARLQAETSKTQVYQAQVEAFSARVTASAKQIDARVAAFRGTIDAKNAEWEGYRATVQGEASRVQSIASLNSAGADIYRAEVTGVAAYNETLTKQWQVALDQAQRVTDIGVNAAKANAEMFMTARSLAMDGAKVGAQVTAQLGAAALNMVNYSNSVASSESFVNTASNSESASYSVSKSDNYSVSEIYSYSE